MIKDIWNQLSVCCGKHAEPIPMELVQRGGIFSYQCADRSCKNEISSMDIEKLIDQISERMEEGYALQNVKGFSCKIRRHICSVVEHAKNKIVVSIK